MTLPAGCACLVLLASCSYRLDYRGEFGKGLVPADPNAASFVSMAAFESPPRLYVRLPTMRDDDRWRSQVLTFSLPDGRFLGPLLDGSDLQIRALRLTATPAGDLGVLTARPSDGTGPMTYGVSIYTPEGVPVRDTSVETAVPGDSKDDPAAVAFAITDPGDLLVLYRDPGRGGRAWLARYRSVFGRTLAKPDTTVDLGSFRPRLPVSVGGGFDAASLHYRNGVVYVALDMTVDPFDGVLVLGGGLELLRYTSSEWMFNGPVSVATDASGRMYVSNRWRNNVSVLDGGRVLTESAKADSVGSTGIYMNNPGAIAIAGDDLYAYDSGNGRIVRFSTAIPGASAERRRLEAFERLLMLRNAPDGEAEAWLLPFVIGLFAMMALHGFFVWITSRERVFVFFGLLNLAALPLVIDRFYYRFLIDPDSLNLSFSGPFLFGTAYFVFAREYLAIGKRNRKWARFLTAIQVVMVAILALVMGAGILGFNGDHFRVDEGFALAGLLLVLPLVTFLIVETARGNREARVFLTLNVTLLLAGCLSIPVVSRALLGGTGLERLFSQGYPTLVGLLLGSFTLSIDLGSRLGTLRAARERSLAEMEGLKELDRQKTDFVMNVSHELRTPLAVILGVLEQLKPGLRRGPSRPADAELGIIERNARRLLKDISNLLELARLDQRQAETRKTVLPIGPLLEQIVAEFSPLAASRGIELALSPPEKEISVLADQTLLETAVLNLLSNALKFTPRNGAVRIRACRDESSRSVRIAVSDTGIGIEDEHRKGLFRRFFRGEAARRNRYEGVGLGLSLVREAAQRHGGCVEVESEAGRGSTFTIVLPAEPGAGQAGNPVPERVPDHVMRGYRAELETASLPAPPSRPGARARGVVLLVEDNADLRSHLHSVFSRTFDVRAVADGVQALASMGERRPDCIVSDIMMPEMDGRSLLAAVRRDPRWRDIPFLFLTARADREEKLRSLRDGALDYMEKPFSAVELTAKVENLLSWNRSVSAGLKTRIKNSISTLIDDMDSDTPSRSTAPQPFDHERLFRDKKLTQREAEVAGLILSGMSDKRIALRLHISVSTVGNHNTRIFRKLGVSSRIELLGMVGRIPQAD